MGRKRVLSFILTGILALFQMSVTSYAKNISEYQPISEKPEYTLIGSTIADDNEHFELTLQANPAVLGEEGAEEKSFYSAAVVLQYNAAVITPVTWDGYDIAVAEVTDGEYWTNVTAIPAVGPPEISGKSALACRDGDVGYLCLSAETALTLKGDLPNDGKLMTVRFKYVGDGKDKVTVKNESDAYLFGKVSLADGGVIELAQDTVAAASPAGQQMTYCAGDASEGLTDFFYTNEVDGDGEINTAGMTYDKFMPAPKFTLTADGESANAGGSRACDYVTITFFDWDESTLLGSIAVPKGADASDKVAEFEETLKDPNMAAGDLYSDNADYPLTNKKGYTFDMWIDYYSDTRTHWGATTTTGVTIDQPIAEKASFTNMQGDMVLKAVYGSNSEINTGADNVELGRYTMEIVSFERLSTSPNYSVKILIKRENANHEGVPRTSEPGLKVVMKTGTTELWSLVSMENVDEQIVEVIPTSDIKEINCAVLDIYGLKNWSLAGARTVDFTRTKEGTADITDPKASFLKCGNIRMINSAVEPGGTLSDITAACLTNADTGLGLTVNVTARTIGTARTNIQKAWQAKNPGYDSDNPPEFKDLTMEEIEYAINNAGALKAS